jgi:hypothetical protein
VSKIGVNAVRWPPAPLTITWPPPDWAVDRTRRPRKARGARKPSTRTIIEAAKKAGATSVTTPDGSTVRFGEAEPTPDNELDEWIAKHAHSAQRH